MTRVIDNLRNTIQPVHSRHRNQLCKDWIESCSTALQIPIIPNFNKEIRANGQLTDGVGFFNISYNPDDGRRSSASVAYIHPILRGHEKRPNLTLLTNAWVSRINVDSASDAVTGVDLTLQSGEQRTLRARRETILCAGAVDTPRLMLLSGLGPHQQLNSLGIPVVRSILGVGKSRSITRTTTPALIIANPNPNRREPSGPSRDRHHLGAEASCAAEPNHHGLRRGRFPASRSHQCSR